MTTKLVRLGDCCEITSSKRIYAKEYEEDGIPFFRGKEIIEKYNGNIKVSTELFISQSRYESIKNNYGVPSKDDLLLTSVGTIGIPYRVESDEPFYFKDGNLTWFRNFIGINSLYLYYWLVSHEGKRELSKCTIGAAQPAYTIVRLKEIKINLPSLNHQNAISEKINAYDKLIENNKRRIALLEESARQLYKEWFVRFRFPGHEHVKIVDGVPEGWEKSVYGEVAETIGGGTPSTKIPEYWDDGNITWFVPKDLTQNNSLILLGSGKKITKLGLQKSSAKMLPPNTIMMSSRASIGYFGLYESDACTNQGFISIVPRRNNTQMYLLHNLMFRKSEIIGLAGGTTYKEINKTTFRSIDVLLPPDALLTEFQEYVSDLLDQVRLLMKQNNNLTRARDLLLPKLMNGEIAV